MALHRRNIRHNTGDKCSTAGCGETAKILDKCPACYRWSWYWNKQLPKKRLAYTRRVERTHARVQELVGMPRLRVVHSSSRRKTAGGG